MTGFGWLVVGGLVGAAIGGKLGASKPCPDGSCPLTSGAGRGALTGAIFGGVFAFLLAGGGTCPFVSGRGGQSAEPAYVSSLPALTDETFTEAVAEGIVLVDFWAAWCGPCQRQLPILDALAPEVKDQFGIVKVNVDEQPELAKTYGISRLPTLVFFRDGKPVKTLVGTQSPEALKKAFAELPGGDS